MRLNLILAFTAALIILVSYYVGVRVEVVSMHKLLMGFEFYILPVIIGIFIVFFIVRMFNGDKKER